MSSWRSYESLIRQCYEHAQDSRDPSTQNAAVLAVDGIDGGAHPYYKTWACNQLTRGIKETPEVWERPLKYKLVEHAERGAIYNAAREGIATSTLTLICNWALCADCARAVVCSGISKLVTHKQSYDHTAEGAQPMWADSYFTAYEMLAAAGVEVVMVDKFYGSNAFEGALSVLYSGKEWQP
jgi:dCMP deaminase